MGPTTPRNNFVFVPNRLPSQFTRRPEMTGPLPTKIGPIKGGMGHAKPSGSSVRHFVFLDIDGRYFLIGRCPHGQPNTNAMNEWEYKQFANGEHLNTI